MPALNLRFVVVNSDASLKELTATLYLSPKAQKKPFENIDKLKSIKGVHIDENGYGQIQLSEDDVKALRKEQQVLHLAFSIDLEKSPIFISGTQTLANLKKAKLFGVDIKGQKIIPNYKDEGENSNGNGETQDIAAGSTLSEQAKEALELREKMQGELATGFKQKLKDRKAARKKRREFVKKLLMENIKRKRQRKGNRYVEPGGDTESKQKEDINRGLERLRKQMLRGMAMYLTKEFLEELGIDIGKDWKKLTKEDWEKIKAILNQKLAHKRKNRLIEDCRKAHLAEDATDALATDNDGTTTTDVTPAPNSDDPSSATLEQIFEKLCADLSARLDTNARPGMDDIEAAVQKSIAAGPADTTAYYDFHTLAIAWEDTWTSVYDDYTEKRVAKVYDEIVQLVGEDLTDDFEENVEYMEMTDFLDDLSDALADVEDAPGRRAPTDLIAWFPKIETAWSYLSIEDQSYLRFLLLFANESEPPLPIARAYLRQQYPAWMVASIPAAAEDVNMRVWSKSTAMNIVAKVEDKIERDQNPSIGRLGRMMEGIHARLYKEPYDFDVFAPGSYNYGLINTFQQKWKPLNYQVGDLISTMPLTPGEKKTYSVKNTINSKTTDTRKQSSSLSGSRESSSSAKSQADIVAKATYSANTTATVNTNFGMTVGVFNGGGNATSTTTGNAASESQTTKQNIREMTLKAAQEYKDERSLEVVASVDSTSEYTMTSEITNPNNEITVTYLFYELQRRFEVSSRLDKLTPVVMVAFEVPKPSDIDEDWLLTYDWILRKALMDPSLAVALDYIREGFSGDELSVEILKAQWETQVAIVQDLKDNVQIHRRYRDLARQSLQSSAELVADKFGIDDLAGAIRGSTLPATLGFLGPIGAMAGTMMGGKKVEESLTSDLTKDEVAAAQESARMGMEWAAADMQEIDSKYKSALYALEKATEEYTNAVKQRQKMRTRIDQLRIHVKENILYYMQAIWAHEPADQRYFRLYDQDLIWPEADDLPELRRVVIPPDPEEVARAEFLAEAFGSVPWFPVEVKIPGPKIVEEYPTRPLHQIADLDNLLGFKGNYAIFPLREGNAVTDYMSQEFLDDYFGITDPDPHGNIPTESEALKIAKCLWKKAGNSDEKKQKVVQWLTNVLQKQIYVSDEIVVPSGELFIEALPGAHPLLEDFKLRHRAVDVQQAQQNLTHSRIESLRYVKRLLDGDLSDPNIDKNIQVSGVGNINVDTE